MEAGGPGANRDVNFWLRARPDPNNARAFRTLAQQIQETQSKITQGIISSQATLANQVNGQMQQAVANIAKFRTEFQNQVNGMVQAWNTAVNNINANQPRAGGGTRGGGGSGRSHGSLEYFSNQSPAIKFGKGAIDVGQGLAMAGLFGEQSSERLLQGLIGIQSAVSIGKGVHDLGEGFGAVRHLMAYNMGAKGGVPAGAGWATAGIAAGQGGVATVTIGAVAAPAAAAIAAALGATLVGSYVRDYRRGDAIGTTAGGFIHENAGGRYSTGAGGRTEYTGTWAGRATQWGVFGGVLGIPAALGMFDSDERGVQAGQRRAEAEKQAAEARARLQGSAIKQNVGIFAMQDAMRGMGMIGFGEADFEGKRAMLGDQMSSLGSSLGMAQRLQTEVAGSGYSDDQRAQAAHLILGIYEQQKQNLEQQRQIARDKSADELRSAQQLLSIYEQQRDAAKSNAERTRGIFESDAAIFGQMSPAERIEAERAMEMLEAGQRPNDMQAALLSRFGGTPRKKLGEFYTQEGLGAGFGEKIGKADKDAQAKAEKAFEEALQNYANKAMDTAAIERNAKMTADTMSKEVNAAMKKFFEEMLKEWRRTFKEESNRAVKGVAR